MEVCKSYFDTFIYPPLASLPQVPFFQIYWHFSNLIMAICVLIHFTVTNVWCTYYLVLSLLHFEHIDAHNSILVFLSFKVIKLLLWQFCFPADQLSLVYLIFICPYLTYIQFHHVHSISSRLFSWSISSFGSRAKAPLFSKEHIYQHICFISLWLCSF